MALLVNGERIENAAIEEERRALRRLLVEKMPDETPAVIEDHAREWSRENLIEQVLLKQSAFRDPEPIPEEAIAEAIGAEARQEVEVRLRVERLIARVTSHAAKPRRKDIVEYYKKNSEEFLAEETVHAAHIVKHVDETTTEEAAKEAIEKVRLALQAGEPFEKLADEQSSCPGRGGDLGTFPRGQMVAEFDAVVFALTPGDISAVFRTEFGFHIAKLYSRRPEGVRPLEEVMGGIEELLFAQKKQKLVEQHLDALRAKADVQEVA